MALKVNNEVKIGLLVIVAIAALIFGLRLLRGKGLFDSGTDLIAFYDNAAGLQNSAPVLLKGVQIGRVKEITIEKNQKIKVVLHIDKGMEIPKGSTAQMNAPSLISGEKVINITFPEKAGTGVLKDGDAIIALENAGLLDNISSEVSPMMGTVNSALSNIDSITLAVNKIMSPEAQQHLNTTFRNLDATMAELSVLVAALNKQTVYLNGIMKNMDGFAGNLNSNNQRITNILDNAEKATNSLTGPEIKQTLASLDSASSNLNRTIEQINSSDGTLGLLMRDRKMYDNIVELSESLDEVIKDVKAHPAKYINLSVFPSKKRDE